MGFNADDIMPGEPARQTGGDLAKFCTTPVPQDGTHSIVENFIPRAKKH